jgi:predicted amidohydrolase
MNHLPYWERWLDEVGAQGVDLALLPESFNGCGGEHTMK